MENIVITAHGKYLVLLEMLIFCIFVGNRKVHWGEWLERAVSTRKLTPLFLVLFVQDRTKRTKNKGAT